MAGELITPMVRFDTFPPLTLMYTATADVARGDLVMTPAGPAYTLGAAKKDDEIEVVLKSRLVEVPKPNTEAWIAGTRAMIGGVHVGLVHRNAGRTATRAEVVWGDDPRFPVPLAQCRTANWTATSNNGAPHDPTSWTKVPVLGTFDTNVGGFSVSDGSLVLPAPGTYRVSAQISTTRSGHIDTAGGRAEISLRCATRTAADDTSPTALRYEGSDYGRGAKSANGATVYLDFMHEFAGERFLDFDIIASQSHPMLIDGSKSTISAIRIN